jgi:hypothetical protein
MESCRCKFMAFNADINYNEVYVTEHRLLYNSNYDFEIFIKYVTDNYKLLLIHYWEEFIYDDFICKILNLSVKYNLHIYIFSLNPILNKFIKNKLCISNIHCNSSKMLFIYGTDVPMDVYRKDINLLFLNYNRKINRDNVICKLYNRNLLYDDKNYISYHNYFTIQKEIYYKMYEKYSKTHKIDLNFLETLKLNTNEFDVHNQHKNMSEVNKLHDKTKFNIICEPFVGIDLKESIYDTYNYFLSRKTTYPLAYKNVFYIHEDGNLLTEELKNIGFKMFFNTFDEFIENINNEFYYKQTTIDILNHNYLLCKTLTENASNSFSNHIKDILKNV